MYCHYSKCSRLSFTVTLFQHGWIKKNGTRPETTYNSHETSFKGLSRCSATLLFNRYAKNEVCEGYVFTGVCLSTGGVSARLHAGIHIHPPRQTPPSGQTPPWADTPWQTPPPGSACWDTVNKRAVCIPLDKIR